MILWLSLGPQNQREVLVVITTPTMMTVNDSLSPPVQVPEGAPPAAPNIVDGPHWSTREKNPIDRFVPGANNI